MMRTGSLLLALGVVVLAIAGCASDSDSAEQANTANRIKLTCKIVNGDSPCKSLDSQDPELIAAVETAIANAEPMPGMLNYAAESILRHWTADGMDSYYLNLESDRKSPALLVKWPDTSTGYEISKEDANRLRDAFGR